MTGSDGQGGLEGEFWRRRLAAVVHGEVAWQAELEARRDSIEAQAAQLAALDLTRRQMAEHIKGLDDRVADREREIARLFGEVTQAHRQLHEVWSSFSWQATIPIRSISTRMPGLARIIRRIGGRYPNLLGATVGTLRGALRPLLNKSPAAPAPAPEPQPGPLAPPSVERPAGATAPPPRNWTCAGDMDAASAAAGDHVLFTGTTPSAPEHDYLQSLAGRGIGFSLVVGDVAPDSAAAWLRVVLTHARGVFVPDAAVRDRILRWAVLTDVFVSAAVEAGPPSEEAMTRLIEAGSVGPLAQPGRLFLPGIVAPDPLPALAAAEAWCTEDAPEVSIVIVNRNSARAVRACIQHVWANTICVRYEIVVADIGNPPADPRALSAMGRGVRLLPVGSDRFFGEACNVAAEQVRSRLLCLLDDDCFVQPGWLPIMVEALAADPSAGAAGPLLITADAATWGSGGMVGERGAPLPFGRQGEPGLRARQVDYVSSAALLVRRDAFLNAGGFDLMYEPELFEDVDLGLKLGSAGLSVRSCPAAHVVQVTGATQDQALVDLNRGKFASRWAPFLQSRSTADLAAVGREIRVPPTAAGAGDATLPTAVFYTPYAITPGGGERFLLTMATELMRDHRVTIVTPNPYSQLRLQSIAHTLGIDLSRVRTQTAAAFAAAPAPDLMVALGNFVYPPVEARTANAVYICQFPFPLEGHPPRIDRGYRSVIAYSDYARTHILAAMQDHGMPPWPVEIVFPPVPQLGRPAPKRPIVLTVGRFFAGGHNKRHDLMIEAFRRLRNLLEGELELHLAGSSTPGVEHMRYLEALMRSADGLPVRFHVNASPETLEGLYRRASVYWHATGLGADLAKHPERAEHFGISLVEAMSTECVALAFGAGGPREIITSGIDGFLFATIDELVALTAEIMRPDAAARRQAIGHAAAVRAKAFAPNGFAARVRQVLLDHSPSHLARK